MLTDLADVARAAGLTVVETPGWRTRGHGDGMGPGRPRSVTVHHTGGAATGDAPSLAVVRDGRPDLAGPLAHFLIARSGTVHVVAAGLCWHTGATREPWQGNSYAIGLECEHTGRVEDPWPPVQLDAMTRLCRALCSHYDVPHARVLAHREICAPQGRKTDPVGIDMRAFRAALHREEITLPSAEDIAAAVWARTVENFNGDTVRADQVLVATEQRVDALQSALAELRVDLGLPPSGRKL